MFNLVLINLAFEVPKILIQYPEKNFLIKSALYVWYETKHKIVIEIKKWLPLEF